MDFRTPWDDWDLDLVLVPPVPRLKLATPIYYLNLLPYRPSPKGWEERWQKAGSAHDLRIITAECMEYEKTTSSKITASNLNDSTSAAAQDDLNVQSKTRMCPKLESVAKTIPGVDQKELGKKRDRADRSENLSPTPKPESKRLKLAKGKKSSTPAEMSPQENKAKSPTIVDSIVPTVVSSTPSHGMSDMNPFNNADSSVNIVDVHQKIYKAIETLHDLVAQAQSAENNLLAIQSRTDITVSSLEQSAMSREELEHLHGCIQTSAEEALVVLEAAVLSAHNSIGLRSLPLAEFKAHDPRSKVVESYDWEIEWQIKDSGMIAWWMACSNNL